MSSSLKNEFAPLVANNNGVAVTYGTDDNAPTTATTFHRHTIGMWRSMALAVYSLTGPAIFDLPATFQRSG